MIRAGVGLGLGLRNVSDAFNGHDPSDDILTKYQPLEVLGLHTYTFNYWKSIG